ncbi:hybrid sensor histidine kinase/response regulator [Piscinibacter terrae]|uniref:histidine kinase n=1 Tax=Piscinibacter terrae TaxID=2496871 RepID=A0A3N7HT50_9BURK|nr:ATP-binding protein [Albitalea terrae]RQP24446.1 PAS domain S-box protein [Albitalea terrae]
MKSDPASDAFPELGAIISRVQSRFIRAAPPNEVFDPLLTDLLEFTGSEYGFIGEVIEGGQSTRFLRLFVLTDISWNEETHALYQRHRQGQPIEFHNLSTLFGAAITSGQTVIANDPPRDPRRGTLPGGHPDLNCFLGVPMFHGGEMVGMVGLANRAGGYDERLAEFLQPLFASVAAIIGAVRMDAARRAAEQALRESEERLRNTFEMAAVGIAHVSPDGGFLRVNHRLCEILGREREELLRMRFQDVTLPEDLDIDLHQVRRLLAGEAKSYVLEKRYRHANGGVVWVSLTVAMVRDRDDKPAYFISVIEDITARKQTQAALLAAQAAERANAAKTEFLSRMSHELRTPLNAVLGFAQLLQMDAGHALSRDQQEKLAHIESAGAHLLAMINDVLDLSRIESGGMPLTAETVPLEAAVSEAVALVATAARDAQVRIRLEPPSAHEKAGSHVQADHLRLRQVLVNLLSNAIKYNHRDGCVTVRWQAAPDGEHVLLQVVDTGQGLSAEQRAHLFEPFNRLGAERSSIEGTGIGLVVTQRLVQLMGGSIEVTSQPGLGSCFSVSLPAAPGSGVQASVPDEGSPWAPPAASSGSRRRTILYAEDNPMNVELVREVLRMREDCVLLVARSGREAITMAQSEHPDLLLLDMHLGDMTGLDVAQRLGRDGMLRQIPIVGLSADAMPAPIAAANEAGFKAYLTKPLNIGEFLTCIDRLLAEKD